MMRKAGRLAGIVSLVAALTAGGAAAEEGEKPTGDPELPWLDNQWYKLHLDLRARIALADIDGFDASQAYTIRTRAGLESKPYYGFSALAELENTWSLADSQYWDGASNNSDGKSVIADPENTELNRIWGQYSSQELLGLPVSAKAKGGRQRIIFDDERFIGNIPWRQNEQTFDAALGESNLSIEGLTVQYAYLWEIQRIFGDQGPTASTRDFSSDSSLVRVHYEVDGHGFTGFTYLLDFENDSPANSSNSYGVRAAGRVSLSDDFSLGYSLSYAFQTEAGDNPTDYEAHYGWAQLDVKRKDLGLFGVTYEHLGSDDGKAVFVTPISTAHKFNGFADAFLDNGGARGLRNLVFTLAPELPWKFKGKLMYHEFWRDDGGGRLGREFDALLIRPFNKHLSGSMKFAVFDGTSKGPSDRWRLVFDLTFKY
jgi:hypothetical protein